MKDHDLSNQNGESFLNRNTNIKYIGVITDRKINWSEHTAHVKINYQRSKKIGILYKTRKFLDKKGLHTLYYYCFIYYFHYI